MGPLHQSPDPYPEPGRADRALQVLDQGQAPPGIRRLTASPSRGQQLHRFCQFDFPFSPGPSDGRYLLRGPDGVADVIALRTLGAELKRSGVGRRAGRRRPTQAAPGDETEPVAVTRVTVIRGKPFEDLAAAREWLAGCGDAETAHGEVAEALKLLNRAIHAHRVSAADPYVTDLSLTGARQVRLGYGGGDELVEGRWRDAYVVPPQAARTRRRRMLEPEEQLARILSGRRPAHASEDLLLRARLDLDQGRGRAAALQANLARVALENELGAAGGAGASRDTLRAHGELLERLAGTALERELTEDEIMQLEEALLELERVARRRRHAAE